MTLTHKPPRIFQEIAEFLASSPSWVEVVNFRPSKKLQQRARRLLIKQRDESISETEKTELTEFLHAEILMGLVKAKIHADKKSRP